MVRTSVWKFFFLQKRSTGKENVDYESLHVTIRETFTHILPAIYYVYLNLYLS